MSSKRHSLNLYDVETSVEKFDVDVHSTQVDVQYSQPIKVHPKLELVRSDGLGTIKDVAADIVALQSSSGSVAALEAKHDSEIAAINTSIGTNTAAIATETAQRQAAQTADAAARATLETNLQASIDSNTAATSTVASDLASEITNRTNADTALQSAIDVEKGRLDDLLAGSSVNLDTLVEIVNAYQSVDTSTLATITALQTQVSDLEAVVAELTSSA